MADYWQLEESTDHWELEESTELWELEESGGNRRRRVLLTQEDS